MLRAWNACCVWDVLNPKLRAYDWLIVSHVMIQKSGLLLSFFLNATRHAVALVRDIGCFPEPSSPTIWMLITLLALLAQLVISENATKTLRRYLPYCVPVQMNGPYFPFQDMQGPVPNFALPFRTLICRRSECSVNSPIFVKQSLAWYGSDRNGRNLIVVHKMYMWCTHFAYFWPHHYNIVSPKLQKCCIHIHWGT